MKTAVNIRDDIFREAEQHARRTGRSRSRLYTDALAEFLARHAAGRVTEQWNDMLDSLSAAEREESQQLARAATADLKRKGEWSDD